MKLPVPLRAFFARRKRRKQIRELEQCLTVVSPLLEQPAMSLDDVMARHDTFVHVIKARWCLSYLRGQA
jgi:hypothetical protein